MADSTATANNTYRKTVGLYSILNFENQAWKAILFSFIFSALFWVTISHKTGAMVLLVCNYLICLYYALKDLETALCCLAFFIPFEQMYASMEVVQYNIISYLFILVLVFTLTGKQYKPNGTQGAIFFIPILLLLWYLICSFRSENPDLGYRAFNTLLGGFVCWFLYSKTVTKESTVVRILWFYLVGTILLGTIGLIYFGDSSTITKVKGADEYFDANHIMLGLDMSSIYYGWALSISAVVLMQFLTIDKRKYSKIFIYVLAGATMIFALLTVRRAVVITILILIIFFAKKLIQKSYSIGLLIGGIITAMVILAFTFYGEQYSNKFEDELVQNEGLSKVGNKRSFIWETSIDIYEQNPVFGIGPGNFLEYYVKFTGEKSGRDIHSTFLGFLIETGTIGFILFIVFLSMITARALKLRKWRMVAISWIIIFIFNNLFHSLALGKDFWMPFGLIIALSEIESKKLSQ